MQKSLYQVLSLVTIMALMLMALPTQDAQAVSTTVAISQFQVAGATAADEFVELHNVGNGSVDLNGHRLVYRSAAGTGDVAIVNWTTSTVIPAGGYYLIAAAVVTGAGYDDAVAANITFTHSGTGSFAAAGGGFALRNGAANTGTIIDSVGYGTATNAFVEGAVTTVPAANASKIRKVTSCQDTDNNSADFDLANPSTPRNSASPANVCGTPTPTPTPTDTSIPTDTPTPSDTATSSPTSVFTDTPTPTATDTEVPTNTPMVCDQSFTRIYSIQGSGTSAAITGNVTTQGVVVGDFETSAGIQGFYIQDAAGDGNTSTSDGIFVFTGTADTVSAGQVVRVTGFARERFSQTALNASNSNTDPVLATNIVNCGTGSVTVTDVNMPFASTTDPERYEGMYVRFPQSLVISEYFNYDQFGEIVLALPLTGEPRPFTGTAIDAPGAAANARTAANALRRITLDDAQAGSNPTFLRHPNGNAFALNNLFRGADTVQNAIGVLGFDFSLYRIYPTGPANYTSVNPRPVAPEPVAGSLRVAAMNTLNFFLTLDTTASDSGGGPCGGNANLDCRGADADQPNEFPRQRAKLLQALAGLNADIIGLNELENTPGVDPLGDPTNGIVAGLNDIFGAGTYSYINTGVIGTDAIRVGIIYKPGVVTPVGTFQTLDSTDDPRFNTSRNRPSLAQTFDVNATGGRLTVVVNHLKSKGSSCGAGDDDTTNGQGNCNLTRTLAAQALVDWLATDPTGSGDPDFLIIGDLNSYAMEDPITAIKQGSDDAAGTGDDFTNLIFDYHGPFAYSYTFDGQAGYLDHALANTSLAAQITGAADWHINSDEADVIDYDTTFKPPAQEALYEPNAYRSSDHDSVIVGMNLTGPAATATPSNTPAFTDTATNTPIPTDTPTPTNTPTSSSIVISQVYGGGGNSGATYTHDFIELYNRGASPVNITGWSVQYASSAGTSWSRTDLSGTLQPGQYYLIQEAQGAGGTTPLPTPNAIGTIAMSATAGKVALVNNTTTLTGSGCPFGAAIVDFVGYGAANCFEGGGATTALTNTTAALRNGNGATDTNNNNADFTVGAPNPRNTPPNTPTPSNTPLPTDTPTATPTSTDTPTPSSTPVFTDTPTNTPTITLTPTNTLTACEQTFTPIYTIQGNGLSSSVVGTSVTTKGVVVGDFEGTANASGFYIQDLTGDGDATTSDGIFVLNTSASLVSVGDVVRVTGFVRERFNQTTLAGANNNTTSVPAANIVNCGTGSVPVTDVTLPFANADFPERYEGMLVRFPQSLVIAEYFNYDRFGEIVLARPLADEPRPFSGTALDEPGAAAKARTAANALSRITLDDVQSAQNPSTLRHPNGSPFSLANRFRGGDTVQNAVGVLGFDFSLYRIFPTGPATYTAVNPRPASPESVGGSLRVAAMNTLNFFVTLDALDDDSSDVATDNVCGGNANLDCRGADASQPTEFNRQRDKLLTALSGLSADVIGLNELENTPNVEPLASIVSGMPGYAYINTGTIGTDAIKVGIIYRPSVVTPIGPYKVLTSAVDPRFIDTKSRPSLAQTFEVNATGARFTIVVNHFKSKGSACTDVGDPDLLDGQGNCSQTRRAAAEALVDWLATDPTGSGDPDFIIMGDLNSYAMEDTIDEIKAGADDTAGTGDDFTNLIAQFQGTYAYSYTFDGQAGYLDHALANASLLSQVTGATEWHINSDEPDVLDYDTSFKPAAQEALYEVNQYRTSDHDAVVVGLTLPDPIAPDTLIDNNPSNPSNSSTASFSISGTDNVTPSGSLTFECQLDGGGFSACSSPRIYTSLSDGSHTFQVRAIDAAGNVDPTPASFTWVIDATAPNTTINSNPSNPTNSTSASFTFSGTDAGTGVASFECDLDGGGFAACTSPQNYTSLSDGSHTFQVRAIDGAGNVDGTPASFTWRVDTVAPTISVATGGMCASSGGTMNLTVNDTSGATLTLSGTSSNTTAVPNANIVFGGSSSSRTVAITAVSGSTVRTATVTITVSDGVNTASTTITVTVGTSANNILNGTSGADLILGLDGNDTLNGLAGNDLLCGGAKNDTLNGGDNDDTLRGEAGNDVLTGGANADLFSGGPGNDMNTDFNAGQGDTSDGT